MAKSVLVVVDGDARVHRALAPALAEGPHPVDVVPCTTARGALNACCAIEPDCVLTELSLSDLDGMWLVAALRKQPSRVGTVPIVVTSTCDDEELVLDALRGGVDVFLGKPLVPEETASQVRALIEMASRLREHRGSVLPAEWTETGRRRAIVGDLNRMSVATVLTALELERRNGDLLLKGGGTVSGGAGKLVLNLAEGMLVGGWRGNQALSPLDALRIALHWPGRRFEFVPSEDRRLSSSAGSGVLGALVLQALRMDEEELAAAAIAEEDASSTDTELATTEPEITDEHVYTEAQLQGSRASTPPPLDAPRPQPKSRIRSGTIPRVTPATAAAPSEAVTRAPGRDLVEKVMPGRRPDPRAEPLELDLEGIEASETDASPDPSRKASSTQNRRAGTDWMDEATTLKMRLR